ncbi:unannotated protein [freshwater metagenome]|uniref:Unannotated protein n=1 Tax=freshwater metagenome TaxID=449393 RepID=A0A6J7EBW8_9ZZZZ
MDREDARDAGHRRGEDEDLHLQTPGVETDAARRLLIDADRLQGATHPRLVDVARDQHADREDHQAEPVVASRLHDLLPEQLEARNAEQAAGAAGEAVLLKDEDAEDHKHRKRRQGEVEPFEPQCEPPHECADDHRQQDRHGSRGERIPAVVGRQDRRGVAADQHERRLAKAELGGEAHHQAEAGGGDRRDDDEDGGVKLRLVARRLRIDPQQDHEEQRQEFHQADAARIDRRECSTADAAGLLDALLRAQAHVILDGVDARAHLDAQITCIL